MIEKLMIPNLRRRTMRRGMMLGSLLARSVPLHIIEFYPARDGKQYDIKPLKKGIEKLIGDAYEDGIDFTAHKRVLSDKISPYLLSWHWTWARMLTDVVEYCHDEEYKIILIDDFHFQMDWGAFLAVIYSLFSATHSLSPPKIIQMASWDNYWYSPDAVGPKNLPGYRIMRKRINPGSELTIGLRGWGDAGTIVNREGAQILLEKMLEKPWASPEYHFWELAQQDNQEGFYSTLRKDYLIKHMWVPPELGAEDLQDEGRKLAVEQMENFSKMHDERQKRGQ